MKLTKIKNSQRDVVYQGATEVKPQLKEALLEAFQYVNDFLKGKKFICGGEMTIADIAIFSTMAVYFVSFFFYQKSNSFNYYSVFFSK